MLQGTNWYTALLVDPSNVCEGIPINKLDMHCIKGKGWRETLPRSLRTLWKLREKEDGSDRGLLLRLWRQMPFIFPNPRSVHPTAYGALQAHPGLQSCILVPPTLVHGHGEVGNHLKA